MAEIPTSETPSFHPAAGPPTAILAWSMRSAEFASRRSQALADYLVGLARARQPDEAMAVQVDYWTHMIDDYAAAASGAVAPFMPTPAAGDGGGAGSPRA